MYPYTYPQGTEEVYYSVADNEANAHSERQHCHEVLEHPYELVGSYTEPLTTMNVAYNKLEEDNCTTGSSDPQTTPNIAYGAGIRPIFTSTQDYYISEGDNLMSSMTENEAYYHAGTEQPSQSNKTDRKSALDVLMSTKQH